MLQELSQEIETAMRQDRTRLRNRLRSIEHALAEGRPQDKNLDRLLEELRKSQELRQKRLSSLSGFEYDPSLPIVAKREEILEVIRREPVVVICGETGSGKSTQLPKFLLELGLAAEGMIGHTQPRRIAARSVAARLAEEVGSPLGGAIGFKIRFSDATKPETLVKLMTDGVLLAESQIDRDLNQYSAIIIDEAHERSLNIDFLLGLLKRIQERRSDLKLVITSATIDADRFATFLGQRGKPAPVLEVSGRSYPVETRYRPAVLDSDTGEIDTPLAVANAVDEALLDGPGDILVFLPTEHAILEVNKRLRGRLKQNSLHADCEVLPLFARLSVQEQNKVFAPHSKRRIVLATNVAESSLTVPGIRYVVDTGVARISRFSPRSNVRRLPIEDISQASADQRQGRCGRVAPGVCIRLYSEDDFLSRPKYSMPEIQRCDLAAVVLQTLSLELGELDTFPLLDPPRPDAIREAYRVLFELGAIDENRLLTPIGRRLARFPCSPRTGRILLGGIDEGRPREILIIAAALEIQDPRERPSEKTQAADEAHFRYFDPDSDFISYLKLWEFVQHLKSTCSRSEFHRACSHNFLNAARIREWEEVYRQLLEIVGEQANLKHAPLFKWNTTSRGVPRARTHAAKQGPKTGAASIAVLDQEPPSHPHYGSIHRALLTGLLSNIAQRVTNNEYRGATGKGLFLWPGSNVFEATPKWVVSADVIETTRRYLRNVANIDSDWIEPIAEKLVKRSYDNPYWNPKSVSAMAFEKVTLFGLPIVQGRRVSLGPRDPITAREMLIRHALVEGEVPREYPFMTVNRRLMEDILHIQAKRRSRALILDSQRQFDFFDARIPASVYDGVQFEEWRRDAEKANPRLLHFQREDLVDELTPDPSPIDFPDMLETEGMRLSVEYRYEPGSERDGVSLITPIEGLARLKPDRLGWLVPGLLEEKITALIRALPKHQRRNLVPAPEIAKKVVGLLTFGQGPFYATIAARLSELGGEPISPSDFVEDRLPPHLRLHIQVMSADGKLLAQGRDLVELRRTLGVEESKELAIAEKGEWHRDGVKAWDFGELRERIDIRRNGMTLHVFPAIVDQRTSVGLRLFDTPSAASDATKSGVRRLLAISLVREIRAQMAWFPELARLRVLANSVRWKTSLDEELGDLLVERGLGLALERDRALKGIPSFKAGFENLSTSVRACLSAAASDVGKWFGPMLDRRHEVRRQLEQSFKASSPAVDDVKTQFERLFAPGFLTETPWEWLSQYPRFLSGILIRLKKLSSGGAARDSKGMSELTPYWDRYSQRKDRHLQMGITDPELERYRWMMEEFRVSLFAQELGTQSPISAKRLEKQWELTQP